VPAVAPARRGEQNVQQNMSYFCGEAAAGPAWGRRHPRRWIALLLLLGCSEAGICDVSDSGAGGRALRPGTGTQAAAIEAIDASGASDAGAGAPAADSQGLLRVLVVQSFGNDFAPYSDVAARFRSELSRRWSRPIEFHELSLETSRFAEGAREGPFAAYLQTLFADRRLDLVVAVGGPATRFIRSHRARLFPSVPVLHVATDQRLVLPALLGPLDAATPVKNDAPGQVELILELLPDLENLAIVLGRSPIEQYWRRELARELEVFRGRLHLLWLDDLPLDEMRQRVASLPPHSAVLYALFLVDAAGVPQQHDEALAALAAESSAPTFGLFESQLGRGVVGGRLVSTGTIVDRAVDAASRLLRGESAVEMSYPAVQPGSPIFDSRQLERWRIPASRLPPGSEIRFHPPSPWDLYRWPLLGGLGLFALQSGLIVGLLLQRRHRRLAEGEVRSLHGRLLTTYEQERRRLARELHDDLTQRLARLAIDAAQVERQNPALDGNPTLGRMREELVRLSDDVHTLSRRLHPSILDDLGLTDALRSEAERFARAEQIEVDLRLAETPPELSPDRALCLFRVAQEALRNTAHHAHASRVEVILHETGGGLELGVRDNGVGFDATASRGRPGLGLVSLRERLQLVSGRLEITSVPGQGTIVLARVPLAGAVS
jgi:signal transduction histidine kinase